MCAWEAQNAISHGQTVFFKQQKWYDKAIFNQEGIERKPIMAGSFHSDFNIVCVWFNLLQKLTAASNVLENENALNITFASLSIREATYVFLPASILK